MGAYRLFSWLCSRGLTDTLTWVLGAAALVLVALLLAGILLVMGTYRLFSWLCSRGLTDTLTWVLGAAALVLAALGLLLASRSFRRLKELHL